MMSRHLCLVLLIILITPIVISSTSLTNAKPSSSPIDKARLAEKILNMISMNNIMEHVRELSTHGSRFTGYEGYEWNVKYVYKYLSKELGLNTWIWSYKALVPYDINSTLTITYPERRTFRVYALLPNLIQTCRTPGGIEGKLVYVGKGEVKDFRGIDVRNNIVLMDYNSKSNWMYAMNLGAKAVVFIEPDLTLRGEGDYKSLEVPIKFPRVYIKKEDAKYLLSLLAKGEVRARLNVNMYWREVEVKNVFAFIPGSVGAKSNYTILLAAHLDAYGIVPALTRGVDESCSPAALLEIARILKELKPYWHVLIGFFSGQPLGMAGVRYFANEIFFEHWNQPKYANGSRGPIGIMGDQIRLVLSLDFSSDSPAIALVTTGTFLGGIDWTAGRAPGRIEPFEKYIKHRIGGEERHRRVRLGQREYWEYIYTIAGREYKVYFELETFERHGLPSQVNHISEIFINTGISAVTFFTAHSARVFWETPIQKLDMVNPEMLRPQVELASMIIGILSKDEEAEDMLGDIMHDHRRTAPLGLALLRGKVRYYNYSKQWYDNRWDLVLDRGDFIIAYLRLSTTRFGYRHHFVVKANSTGDFIIPGLKPSGWGIGEHPYRILAFVINNETGNIKWAPDYGTYGTRLWPYGPVFSLSSDSECSGKKPVNIVLFKCGTIVLHDMIDPTTLTTPLVEALEPYAMKLYDSRSYAELIKYGYFISTPPSPLLVEQIISLGIGDPAVGYDALIFVPPNTPVDIVLISIREATPLAIVRGVSVDVGEYLDISMTALRYAEEMLKLAGERLESLRKEPALSGSIGIAVRYYEEAKRLYEQCLEMMDKGMHTEAYTLIYRSWYLARKAYLIAKEVYSNIVYTNVLIMVLLIPTALIIERLILEKRGLKRIISIISILAVLILITYILHPGLRVAWYSTMASLSIVSFILSLPALGFIIVGVFTVAKEIRKKVIGMHFIDVSRLSILSAALSVGIGNLKKRKLRTILTLISIVCMVVSLVLFTAWTFGDYMIMVPKPIKPPYKGMLVKTEVGELSPSLLEYLKGYFVDKGTLAPRAWVRSPIPGGGMYAMSEKGMLSFAKAVIGVSNKEPLLSEYLKEETTQRLWRGMSLCAMITDDLANELGVEIGDIIYVAGIRLTVVEIIPHEYIPKLLMDIDGDLITPPDPFAPPGSPEKTKDRVIILPYELAIRIGGITTSVAVEIADTKVLDQASRDISEHLVYLSTYASDGSKTLFLRWLRGYELKGLHQLIVPLSLMVLILINVMVASIYERNREINIYSSLGLSPMHVASMILTEGIVYAVLGATLGYLVSMAIGYFISLTSPMGYPIDFSSPYPAISLLICMLAVTIAGLYPAVKASTYVTPSLERKWRITTKPRGNEWYIPLPVTTSSLTYAKGLLSYIMEYFEGIALEEKFRPEAPPKPFTGIREGRKVYGIILRTRLPPYDAAIVEDVEILALPDEVTKRVNFGMYSKLLSGKRYLWISSHKKFVDEVRKQMLLWKSLRSIDKKKHLERGEKIFKEGM